MTPIRVAVVDDSSFIRKAIVRMLDEDDRLEVVGTAASGEELLERLKEWRPDVVTLDLSMPGMGGLRALDHLAAHGPTPVIVLSGQSRRDAPLAIEALHRGAVDFIDKRSYSLIDFQALRTLLIGRILEVAGASPATAAALPSAADPPPAARPRAAAAVRSAPFSLLVMGASTGGPVALQRLLQDLGPVLPVPAVVAQHMPPGFTAAFAERLNGRLPLAVREAEDGESLLPATVYIAPAGHHLRVGRRGRRLFARLAEAADGDSHRPSIDILFSSAARSAGDGGLAVLLTGMGRDGAAGMAAMKQAGAYTLAQDEGSSVVWGMPRAAVELGVVDETLALDAIGSRLRQLLTGDGDG